jgi:hypothetical protein
VGAKEIVAKVAAEVKVSPRLEGEAGYLWNAARLEAVTVYLGPVEKITAKGPKTYEYYFASWKDGFRSSKYAYPRDGLAKAELVRGNSPPHLSG